ncbi:MAG: twin-arginine translocase TatA/TatE family subunit [Spirochaetes bacterium]|nr:twin-arginine translocase TatA/TatE family subunit [Spirochaetota bacterium]
MNIGPLEIGLIALVILLLFGARRLPDLARSIGRSITEFKKGVKDEPSEKKEIEDEDKKPRSPQK